MPSPRQARLGTLPSLSFSPISSTNLLGAMKELNSFATLSLPKCHYHNVLCRPTASTGSLLIVFFMGSWRQASADIHQSLAAALVLSMSDKHIHGALFGSQLCSFEFIACVSVFGVCSTSSWVLMCRVRPERNWRHCWKYWSESRSLLWNIRRVAISGEREHRFFIYIYKIIIKKLQYIIYFIEHRCSVVVH